MWLMNNFFPAQRLRTVWMTVLMLLATQTAMADGTETSSNYMVMMAGMDQLQIQMPIYDEAGYDGWIDKGYIYVTPAGGIKQTLLYYYSEEKSGANPLLHYQKGVDGAMTLTPGNNSDVTVSSDLQNCRVSSSSDVFKVTVLWTVPAKMRGMELTISWSLHKKGNGDNITGEKDTDISISPTKITFPAIPDQIKPTVMEPMLAMTMAFSMVSCGSDDKDESNTGTKDTRLSSVVPTEYRNQLERYIEIYDGVNPPNVEGVYLSSPTILVYTSDGVFEPGHKFADKYYKFENQNMSTNTIDYQAKQNTAIQNGSGAFISGDGNNFTIFFNATERDGEVTTKTALVVSGTKTSEGIRNLKYAFVMLDKYDPNDVKMDIGTYRVIKDGDGISEPASWPASAPAFEFDMDDLGWE